MNEVKVLEKKVLLDKEFNIYGTAEEPLFLAKNVAEWVEHTDTSKMLNCVDESEKLTRTLFVSGQNREVLFLTEDGLYEVLMQSRKPIAKEFKKGIKEILKSIRKHGAYMTAEKIEEALLNPDVIINLATQLKAEQEQRKRLESKIASDQPRVLFAQAVETSKTSILIGDLAKIIKQNGYDIGQKRLFDYLREHGYLMKFGTSYNLPTQRAMELGLFEIKEHTVSNPDGSVRITKTTKVTGKGQIYFINKFCEVA